MVLFEGTLTGLSKGTHAIHIHEKADCSSEDGKSSGGHWNPTFENHGAWGGESGYHRGDIGNFQADADGNGSITFSTDQWCLGCDDETKNIINYELLKSMKKNCIIINAARGGIVNEVDLDRALNENLIFGAGLDVFETEPPAENNPLLKNKKVFLSPHTAAFTEECMTRMGKETIQNIFDFFDGNLENSKKVKL